MATYDYRCTECGDLSEYRVPVERRAEGQMCRSCGKPAHRTLTSRVATRIGKDGLLSVPGYPRDAVGRRTPVKNATHFGPTR